MGWVGGYPCSASAADEACENGGGRGAHATLSFPCCYEHSVQPSGASAHVSGHHSVRCSNSERKSRMHTCGPSAAVQEDLEAMLSANAGLLDGGGAAEACLAGVGHLLPRDLIIHFLKTDPAFLYQVRLWVSLCLNLRSTVEAGARFGNDHGPSPPGCAARWPGHAPCTPPALPRPPVGHSVPSACQSLSCPSLLCAVSAAGGAVARGARLRVSGRHAEGQLGCPC